MMVRFMDTGITVPIVRYKFGMDAVVGMVPYAGEGAAAAGGSQGGGAGAQSGCVHGEQGRRRGADAACAPAAARPLAPWSPVTPVCLAATR
jgi:hypothetical protein